MSFKRKVQRDQKTELTHQKAEKKSDFKSHFNFTWIPFHLKSLIILMIIFVFSQFVCVPLLAQWIGYSSSLILIHGVLSSILVVLAFSLPSQDELSLSAMVMRFCFCTLMFGGFSLAFVLMLKL